MVIDKWFHKPETCRPLHSHLIFFFLFPLPRYLIFSLKPFPNSNRGFIICLTYTTCSHNHFIRTTVGQFHALGTVVWISSSKQMKGWGVYITLICKLSYPILGKTVANLRTFQSHVHDLRGLLFVPFWRNFQHETSS